MFRSTYPRGLLLPRPSLSGFVKALGRVNSANARKPPALTVPPLAVPFRFYSAPFTRRGSLSLAVSGTPHDTRYTFVCTMALA